MVACRRGKKKKERESKEKSGEEEEGEVSSSDPSGPFPALRAKASLLSDGPDRGLDPPRL